MLEVSLNENKLNACTNTSSLYPSGVQPAHGLFPPELWVGFDVPPGQLNAGNNTISVTLKADNVSVQSYVATTVVLEALVLEMPVS